jgi:pimeloyl-ACP methyl ester carboxylesterase
MVAGLNRADPEHLSCAARQSFGPNTEVIPLQGAQGYFTSAYLTFKAERLDGVRRIRDSLENDITIFGGHSFGAVKMLSAILSLKAEERNQIRGYTAYSIASRLRWYLLPVTLPVAFLCWIPIIGLLLRCLPLPILLPAEERYLGFITHKLRIIPWGAILRVHQGQFFLWRKLRSRKNGINIPTLFIYGRGDGLIPPSPKVADRCFGVFKKIPGWHGLQSGNCDVNDTPLENLWSRFEAAVREQTYPSSLADDPADEDDEA